MVELCLEKTHSSVLAVIDFRETATHEIYTRALVGSVRGVWKTDSIHTQGPLIPHIIHTRGSTHSTYYTYSGVTHSTYYTYSGATYSTYYTYSGATHSASYTYSYDHSFHIFYLLGHHSFPILNHSLTHIRTSPITIKQHTRISTSN